MTTCQLLEMAVKQSMPYENDVPVTHLEQHKKLLQFINTEGSLRHNSTNLKHGQKVLH